LCALPLSVAAEPQACIMNDSTFPASGGTGRDREKLTEERLLLATHFAAATARSALRRRRSWFRTCACAFGAGLQTLDANGLRRATRDFGEREFQADLDVVSAPPIATRALAPAEKTVETARAGETEVA